MHAHIGLDLHNLYHQPKGEERKHKVCRIKDDLPDINIFTPQEPRKMVVLDVGGERFSAMRSTLLR